MPHDQWNVRELPADTKPSPGPLAHVLILMRRHSLGADFSLHPHSKTLIRNRFPQARPVSSISIEWTTRSDFEREHGPIWDHVAVVLTGLSVEQLKTLEGYEIYDLMAERTIYNSQAVAAAQRNYHGTQRLVHRPKRSARAHGRVPPPRAHVAIPEVDVGDDIVVVRDDNDQVTRVQVKTANAIEQKATGRYTAQFKVPLEQMEKGPQHLAT